MSVFHHQIRKSLSQPSGFLPLCSPGTLLVEKSPETAYIKTNKRLSSIPLMFYSLLTLKDQSKSLLPTIIFLLNESKSRTTKFKSKTEGKLVRQVLNRVALIQQLVVKPFYNLIQRYHQIYEKVMANTQNKLHA